VLGVSLFEPDENRFAIKHKTNAKIEALLPNRVRRKKVILDDDF